MRFGVNSEVNHYNNKETNDESSLSTTTTTTTTNTRTNPTTTQNVKKDIEHNRPIHKETLLPSRSKVVTTNKSSQAQRLTSQSSLALRVVPKNPNVGRTEILALGASVVSGALVARYLL